MAMLMPWLPPGYVFDPTDQELVTYYLSKKVADQRLPCDAVIERDLYSDKAPWEVFTDDDPWVSITTEDKLGRIKTKQILYVLTRLKKIGQKQIVRRAGCGTWHGHTGAANIKNLRNEVIGFKKMLVFQVKQDLNINVTNNSHWIMHEYSLGGISLTTGLQGSSDHVLCRITRDDSKCLKRYEVHGDSIESSCAGKRKSISAEEERPQRTKMCSSSTSVSVSVTAEKSNELEQPVATAISIDWGDYITLEECHEIDSFIVASPPSATELG